MVSALLNWYTVPTVWNCTRLWPGILKLVSFILVVVARLESVPLFHSKQAHGLFSSVRWGSLEFLLCLLFLRLLFLLFPLPLFFSFPLHFLLCKLGHLRLRLCQSVSCPDLLRVDWSVPFAGSFHCLFVCVLRLRKYKNTEGTPDVCPIVRIHVRTHARLYVQIYVSLHVRGSLRICSVFSLAFLCRIPRRKIFPIRCADHPRSCFALRSVSRGIVGEKASSSKNNMFTFLLSKRMFESLYQPNCQVRGTLRLDSDFDCQNGCWNLNTAYVRPICQTVCPSIRHPLAQVRTNLSLHVFACAGTHLRIL